MRKRLVIGGLLAAVALSMVVGIVSARGGSASAPRLSAWGFGAGTASPVPHITQDRRLAAVSTFPTAAVLSASIGLARGLDIDTPAWTDAYYRVARGTA